MTPPQSPLYRLIPLTKGQFALVDDSDFDWLNQWKWQARKDHRKPIFYAQRVEIVEGKRTTIHMHRFILGLEYGNPLQGDHIESSQTLDNRRKNLRIATPSQQMCNQRIRANNTSGFKGVSFDSGMNKYFAQICVNRKNRRLGYADTAKAAHVLYCAASAELHGEFSRTS